MLISFINQVNEKVEIPSLHLTIYHFDMYTEIVSAIKESMDMTCLFFIIYYNDKEQGNKETRKSEVNDMKEINSYMPEKKQVTITSKRQFTIPQKFFNELGFDRTAVCSVSDGKLIIEPVTPLSGGEFAEQILKELLDEGYSGSELLAEFRVRQAKVRPAIEAMLEDARNAAQGIGEYETYEDVFGPKE